MTMGSTITGYPRIGPNRELKFATEAFWADRIDEAQLLAVATELRASTWAELADAGLDSIPGNTFSFYDHVLDTAALFAVLPARFTNLGLSPLRTYFAAARGHRDAPAMELTKWFDTNYHYLVPEIGPETVFTLAGDKPLAEYAQARDLGITTRPVLLGPLTFLLLSKSTQPGFSPLEHLDVLVEVYGELLARLHEQGCEWVQLDEPALVADRTPHELAALGRAYHRLGALDRRSRLLVSGYYGDLGPALPVLAGTPVEAIGLDLVTAPDTAVAAVPALRDKIVLAGVVDGRNIWATDLPAALGKAAALLGSAAEVHVTTSCPLLHVPYDLGAETALEAPVRDRLAFARQKVAEVVGLGKALHARDPQELASQPTDDAASLDGRVRARVEALRQTPARRADYPLREAAQQQRLKLPPLPTTTIGSFPQTAQVRRARRELEHSDPVAYQQRMREEIATVIALQEDIGLDVLVHGEAERNDMVQYFADHLDGIASTQHGWVQSYGSRCVRPPIIHSDVTRPEPITVAWSTYAQSLTTKPVKGMLTGPVTILAWSFVRDDQALADTAAQLALFLREEIRDLEAAGISIVQVDEPALRELLPLRRADQQAYLDWAVDAFRLATAGAAPSTQIHTHLCYSEFGEVIEAINALDADVTTIEAARSRMEVLDDLEAISFSRGIGPGVYDIHSPRVPTIEEMTRLLSAAARTVPAQRLWANPDCGLKTRGYTQVEPALRNLVAAAQQVRDALP